MEKEKNPPSFSFVIQKYPDVFRGSIYSGFFIYFLFTIEVLIIILLSYIHRSD